MYKCNYFECHKVIRSERDKTMYLKTGRCYDCQNFIAILAKNTIARELTDSVINAHVIKTELAEIEAFIGEANQPSIQDIA